MLKRTKSFTACNVARISRGRTGIGVGFDLHVPGPAGPTGVTRLASSRRSDDIRLVRINPSEKYHVRTLGSPSSKFALLFIAKEEKEKKIHQNLERRNSVTRIPRDTADRIGEESRHQKKRIGPRHLVNKRIQDLHASELVSDPIPPF